MSAPLTDPVPPAPEAEAARHSAWENAYAIALGGLFIMVGLAFLKTAGLVTGGTAGLALLLSYLLPLSVGWLFTLLNLPFLVLAWMALGRAFAARTAVVSVVITGLAQLAPRLFGLSALDPVFAALFGGTIIGMGILALARHGAGVGGLGVVALALYRKKGWNAGRTQLFGDALVLALSMPVLSGRQLLLSLTSSVAINLMLIAWHRPGRYTGY